jgi:hypothetical protein
MSFAKFVFVLVVGLVGYGWWEANVQPKVDEAWGQVKGGVERVEEVLP